MDVTDCVKAVLIMCSNYVGKIPRVKDAGTVLHAVRSVGSRLPTIHHRLCSMIVCLLCLNLGAETLKLYYLHLQESKKNNVSVTIKY